MSIVHRLLAALVALGLVAVGALVPRAGVAAAGPWDARVTTVAEGVEHVELVRRGAEPAVVHLARVAGGADVELEPVLAHDLVDRRDETTDRETTSSMCGRAGGTICINGDFALCYSCGQPFGGVVRDGRVVRSFRAGHEQLSLVDGRLTAARQQWAGKLVATFTTPATLTAPARTETHEVPLSGLNVDPLPDGAVLYTPDWGPRTPIVGGAHLRLSTAAPVAPGSVDAQPTALHDEDQVDVGGDVIVSTDGASADRMRAFWHRWHDDAAPEKRLAVVTSVASPAELSIGGHPRLLEGGRRLPLNDDDPKVTGRHPRTLVGWNDGGEMLLLTVDGRQSRSRGVTLHEATDLLLELGATDGMNLDGGGSTTFVGRCDADLCVKNRPSGGSERPVPVALALIAKGAAPPRVAAAAPAPPPPEPASDPASQPSPTASAPPPAPAPPPPAPAPAPEPEPAPEPAAEPPPAPEPPPATAPEPEPEAPAAPEPEARPVGDEDALRRELAVRLASGARGGAIPAAPAGLPPAPVGLAVVLLLYVGHRARRLLRLPAAVLPGDVRGAAPPRR